MNPWYLIITLGKVVGTNYKLKDMFLHILPYIKIIILEIRLDLLSSLSDILSHRHYVTPLPPDL